MRLERRVRLVVDEGLWGEVDLWLAGRRFVLDLGPEASVTDAFGHTIRFREGANLVGRAPYAEIPIDETYADVSRRHLVVEVRDRRVVALTDLSSGGTCVPRSLPDRA